jgi:transcriptional regulator with XRE-family HTH domain
MELLNLGTHIKKLRKQCGYSQEGLAERVFVSRQTISNWETAKSYPDITSLILLSQCFNISIDQLIEGDYEIMQRIIEKSDIRDVKRYSILMAVSLILGLILLFVSLYLGSILGILLALAASLVGLILTCKISAIKKSYDVHTYREIVAFMNGKTLDQITLAREDGKRLYQSGLLIAICLTLDVIVILTILAVLKMNGVF